MTMLDQVQRRFFDENGYLIVPDVVGKSMLETVRQEYADLLDDLYAGWHEDGLVSAEPDGLSFWEKLDQCYRGDFDWFQPLDISLPLNGIREDTPMHIGPAVFELITHRNILDIVEQLIGSEITSNPIQHVRIKPPARALPSSENRAHLTTTDWHQDQGVTLPEADDTKMITVWLAVTDATVENGCLQLFPGRHEEMLPHCTKAQLGIASPFLPDGDPVPAPVKAGGIVLFNPLTPHGSLPNESDGFRWSFDLRYNVTGQPTGRSQFPEFVARSRSDPGSELCDWREWRSDWEATRRRLANAPHIPQHRWQNDALYCA